MEALPNLRIRILLFAPKPRHIYKGFFKGKKLVGCFHHWDFARLLFREHLQPAPEPARNISSPNKSEIPPFRCLSGEVLFFQMFEVFSFR